MPRKTTPRSTYRRTAGAFSFSGRLCGGKPYGSHNDHQQRPQRKVGDPPEQLGVIAQKLKEKARCTEAYEEKRIDGTVCAEVFLFRKADAGYADRQCDEAFKKLVREEVFVQNGIPYSVFPGISVAAAGKVAGQMSRDLRECAGRRYEVQNDLFIDLEQLCGNESKDSKETVALDDVIIAEAGKARLRPTDQQHPRKARYENDGKRSDSLQPSFEYANINQPLESSMLATETRSEPEQVALETVFVPSAAEEPEIIDMDSQLRTIHTNLEILSY